MDKSTDIKSNKEYAANPITAEQMETDTERILWEKQEAAFEKLKQNPELLQTLIRMKDK